MLWLALHLPRLSLETFCATLAAADGAEAGRAVALIDGHHVVAANAAAAAAGVQPGMKRATALALAPELLLAASDPARDAAALHAVAHAALAFTPTVALHDGATVLLEVQACLRLFQGLTRLRQRLLAVLAPLGHRIHLAAAPTPLGAALLAQWQPAQPAQAAQPGQPGQPGQAGDLVLGEHATRLPALQRLLSGLPLAFVAPGREQDLQGLGLARLGDLLRLPRAGLARRFGEDLLDRIDRALGRRADPRQPLEPPARFDARLELHMRAEHTEPLLAAAGVLLARLLAWAQARQSRVAAFTLRMTHERVRGAGSGAPPATELRLALAEPSLDAVHLGTLLRERLARCTLAAPTLELQLHCHDLVQAPPPNGELFPTRASQAEGLARLLERLRARLGDEQVRRLVALADHRPERATGSVPVQAGAPSGTLPASVPSMLLVAGEAVLPLHRPAWLLPDPLPLAERERQPLLDGRPLALLSGPERIETGWWDGEPALRDYFIAAAVDGALVWVFRSRLPVVPDGPAGAAAEATWFLQGRFG